MDSIKGLIPFVLKAGQIAAERQRLVTRAFKEDGSILTQVDTDLNAFLHDSVTSLYPDANVVAEECDDDFDAERDYTFAIDPIDGTDCFSQGMPGWAISIGLLDREFHPVAGIVHGPRWGAALSGAALSGGTLLFSDIGKRALLNGEPLRPAEIEPGPADLLQVMVGSNVHRSFDMRAFPGKIRNVGSTAIHIVAPLLHPAVAGAIFAPNFVWDIAGAHAVITSEGLSMEYVSGRPIDYRPLVARKRAEETIVAGTPRGIAIIRSAFRAFAS